MTTATAGLALVGWTIVMWFWMYGTRIPTMRRLGVDASKPKEPGQPDWRDQAPPRVNWIADNYNHLHEQPVLFYFLVVYSQAFGVADALNVGLAWGYVGLRVVHSIWQSTVNEVQTRFLLFALASLLLMAITLRNVFAAIV